MPWYPFTSPYHYSHLSLWSPVPLPHILLIQIIPFTRFLFQSHLIKISWWLLFMVVSPLFPEVSWDSCQDKCGRLWGRPWPWKIAYPRPICVPLSIFMFLVQRPIYFAGNIPSVSPQPQVIAAHDLHFSSKNLCGWWWMQLFAWFHWAELPGESVEQNKFPGVIWTNRFPPWE